MASPYKSEVESSPQGVLALLFRKTLAKLNLTQKLNLLCKQANLRDKQYRESLGKTDRLDDKLEYRLKGLATDSKMTIETLFKLLTHLLNVEAFKITLSFKQYGSNDWITVDAAISEAAGGPGPMTDANLLTKEEAEKIVKEIEKS